MKSFSRAFRLEMLDYGVNVTTVCPGAIATDLYNLPLHLQRLAVRIGVMMKPDTLAHRAINGMFRHRSQMIPGVIPVLSALRDSEVDDEEGEKSN